MPQWKVQLIGEAIDLQLTHQAFAGGNPIVIVENGVYFLKSKEFDANDDAESVRNRAMEITKLMSDAIHLHSRDSRPIRIGHIFQIEDNGKQKAFVFAEGNIQLRGVVAGLATSSTAEVEHNAVNIFRSATSHEDLAAALAYFSQGDWSNLYKTYELVRDHVGNTSLLIKSGWVTKKKLDSFTQTAQSREAIGDNARHASKKFKAPEIQMSIHEARAFLAELLEKWVSAISKT